jgi:hypothetical protein
MAYYTHTQNPIGVFVEKDTGNYFEFSINEDHMAADENGGFTHKVWVGDTIGSPYRYAVVMKTVAYIAVDEDDEGLPVVEKWYLKKCQEYAN